MPWQPRNAPAHRVPPESLILLLLVADAGPDRLPLSPHRVDEVPSDPEVLPDEVALSFPVNTGEVDRALALDAPDDLRDRMPRRDRDHHMHMVGHKVPLLDPALLLLRKLPEDLAKVAPQLAVQHFSPIFLDEHDVCACTPTS